MNALIGALKAAKKAAILSHVSPDGDAVGSALALCLAMKALGTDAKVFLPGAITKECAFLPGVDEIIYPEDGVEDDFDLIVCVDCADKGRVGYWQCLLEQESRTVVIIDHHVTNSGFGDHSLIRSDAAATGQILTDLIPQLGVKFTPDMALCLYTAISTDTGGFAFSNTSPATLRAAAALVEAGADPAYMYRMVYASRSMAKTRVIARALSNMRADAEDSVIVSVLTQDDLNACNATSLDCEGVIDFLRDVETCKMCALVRDAKDGTAKVSLRCDEAFDVASVAKLFGGGGHRLAAGCTLQMCAKDAVCVLRDALNKAYLEQKA